MSKITIIEGNSNDKDQTRNFMVKGEPGDDGVSPVVEVDRGETSATINITDAEGTKSTVINDGVSPTVSVSKTGGVTTITITDADGTHTATINDGEVSAADLNAVNTRIGNNADLNTQSKGTIVGAVNEVNTKVTDISETQIYTQTLTDSNSGVEISLLWKKISRIVTLTAKVSVPASASTTINLTKFPFTIPQWAEVDLTNTELLPYHDNTNKFVGRIAENEASSSSGNLYKVRLDLITNVTNNLILSGLATNSDTSNAKYVYGTITYIVEDNINIG